LGLGRVGASWKIPSLIIFSATGNLNNGGRNVGNASHRWACPLEALVSTSTCMQAAAQLTSRRALAAFSRYAVAALFHPSEKLC
jgi:hypothetical protein